MPAEVGSIEMFNVWATNNHQFQLGEMVWEEEEPNHPQITAESGPCGYLKGSSLQFLVGSTC